MYDFYVKYYGAKNMDILNDYTYIIEFSNNKKIKIEITKNLWQYNKNIIWPKKIIRFTNDMLDYKMIQKNKDKIYYYNNNATHHKIIRNKKNTIEYKKNNTLVVFFYHMLDKLAIYKKIYDKKYDNDFINNEIINHYNFDNYDEIQNYYINNNKLFILFI